MNILKIIILLSTLCLSLYAKDHIALVKQINGSVTIMHDKNSKKAFIGQKLYEKDVILTGSNGKIGISFNDGSTINLGKNSFLSIEDFTFKPLENDFKFTLNLKKGIGVFKSGKIGKLAPDSFKMKFPQGIIGIRGTKFLIDAG